MTNEEIAISFKDCLVNGDDFKVTKSHDHHFKIQSNDCEIDLLFERYEDGYSIEISEMGSNKEPLNLLLLRFLRGAVESEDVDASHPGRYAKLLNKYFLDLLEGDFSIRKQYDDIYNEFYHKFTDVQCVDDNQPIWIKIKNFDITWMKDFDTI